MRAIYAIYAGLVNPRRSYSQPSLPFALCPYATVPHNNVLHKLICCQAQPACACPCNAGLSTHQQKTRTAACPLRATLLLFLFAPPHFPLFSATFPCPNALKPICRQTPLVARGAATAPATQGIIHFPPPFLPSFPYLKFRHSHFKKSANKCGLPALPVARPLPLPRKASITQPRAKRASLCQPPRTPPQPRAFSP